MTVWYSWWTTVYGGTIGTVLGAMMLPSCGHFPYQFCFHTRATPKEIPALALQFVLTQIYFIVYQREGKLEKKINTQNN